MVGVAVTAAATAAAAAAAGRDAPATGGGCPSPPTVADFSMAALGGTWYQAAISARFAATVEAGAPCITAHYTPGVAADGAPVAAVRSCMPLRRPTPSAAAGEDTTATATPAVTGERRVVACSRGLLTTPDMAAAPGRLALSFPPLSAGRYWVLAVDGGPASDGDGGGGGRADTGGGDDDPAVPPYTTAVVWSCAEADAPGAAATQDLLVLSRTRGLPRAAVTAAADAAAAAGVDLGPDNGMVMTDQGAGCVYWDDDGVTVVEG